MKISYDNHTDTLYIFTGDQTDTVARDIGNGILIKYNQAGAKVGAVVHDFEARFKKQNTSIVEIPAFA